MTSRSTPETFTSAPPLSSTPPAILALQHNQVLLAPSDDPSLPSSTASNPVLDNILPAESCRSIMVTAPSASSGPASVSDVGAAAMGDASQKLGLRENKDALDLPSVNRAIHENTIPTLGLLSQAPSLPSITDSNIDIAGPSSWEQNAERIGDNVLHPSHDRHDIV
ncbi:hypothetical protein H4582DRAFT_1893857 [Lactarius indigo]|nr:hypothetical protein H4582DRAFT_1893857 [Lactarius indigo]